MGSLKRFFTKLFKGKQYEEEPKKKNEPKRKPEGRVKFRRKVRRMPDLTRAPSFTLDFSLANRKREARRRFPLRQRLKRTGAITCEKGIDFD